MRVKCFVLGPDLTVDSVSDLKVRIIDQITRKQHGLQNHNHDYNMTLTLQKLLDFGQVGVLLVPLI